MGFPLVGVAVFAQNGRREPPCPINCFCATLLKLGILDISVWFRFSGPPKKIRLVPSKTPFPQKRREPPMGN